MRVIEIFQVHVEVLIYIIILLARDSRSALFLLQKRVVDTNPWLARGEKRIVNPWLAKGEERIVNPLLAKGEERIVNPWLARGEGRIVRHRSVNM